MSLSEMPPTASRVSATHKGKEDVCFSVDTVFQMLEELLQLGRVEPAWNKSVGRETLYTLSVAVPSEQVERHCILYQ